MIESIPLYPTIDDGTIEAVKPRFTYSFSYLDDDGMEMNIPISVDRNKDISMDSKSPFMRDYDDLHISLDANIECPKGFFGTGGVAPTGSQLGLAIECFSQKSRFKTTKIAEASIDGRNIPFHQTFSIVIPKRSVDSTLEINVLVFMRNKSENVPDEEAFLNNQEGVILGFLDSKTVFMSGSGSLFPILNQPLSTNELWDLQMSYEDPATDQLVDSVKLILNSTNKNYACVNPSCKEYCEPLIYEIVADAMTLLIVDLKDKGYLEDLDQECEDGSILQEVKYLKNTVGIDVSDVKKLSSSLRSYLEGAE